MTGSRAAALTAIAMSACKAEPATAKPSAVSQHVALACPDGATQRGAAPPDGDRIWCETRAGVSDGPFRSWFPGGERKTEGTFVRGAPDGEWAAWYVDGRLRSRGRYEHGAPVGEWEKFEPDGSATPADAEPPTSLTQPPAVTGVPICDLYIYRYSKCIETKAPDDMKAYLRDAVAQTVDAWKQAAARPDIRDALEPTCNAAYDAVKPTAEGWGCEM